MHQKRYGYVVIGAGLGGLGAAVELAGNGADTLLLERHNLPGGNATSFVRGRFEFEPSLHEIGSAGFGEEKYGLRAFIAALKTMNKYPTLWGVFHDGC